jgi:O-antigen/teichoic acid export membrane protein
MAGQYRIIDQIIMIFRTYLQMFFNFVYADVCLQIFNNAQNGFKAWIKYNALNYILIVSLVFLVYLFSNNILLFFKTKTDELVNMRLYLTTGLFIPMLMGISFALKQLLFALNKNKEYIRITIITTILSLIFLYMLLSKIGLQGAFLSITAVELIVVVLYYIVLKSNFRFNQL